MPQSAPVRQRGRSPHAPSAGQLAPGNYLGYSNLGAAYVLEGRYSDAIAAFKHSIELRPSLDAYENLGYIYTLMHRYSEAIAALQPDRMTPREALDELYRLQNLLQTNGPQAGRQQVSAKDT